ncbi:MAG: hypothetical protein NDF55_10030 [archaeon GB-1867-005]|nr:hypothetical protein [Candidatus Culexmicrobium cathedralense]
MSVESEVIKRPLGVTALIIICLFNVGLSIIFSFFNLLVLPIVILNIFWVLGLYGGYKVIWMASLVQLPFSFIVLALFFSSFLFWIINGIPEFEYNISMICYMLITIGIMPAGLGLFLILLINMLSPPIYNILTSIEPFNRYLAIVISFIYVIITINYLKKEKVKKFFLK